MKAVRLSLALLLVSAHILGASLPLAPVSELFPVVPHPQAESGSAVALDSGWLVVGAPLDNAAGKNAGAVRVFRWAAGFWMQKAELLPSLPQEGARFGSAVAIRGGLLVVGAVGEGAVYLFEEDEDNSWKQMVRLSRGESERGSFGRSLALDRAADRVRLAVGSVAADGTGGVVYVYNGPDWVEPEAVRPLTPQPADGFGTSVALDRCVLAVGAPGHDLEAGAVFAFEQQETWKQAGQLMAVDAQAGDGLGSAVAAGCNEILAGAPGADRAGEDSGATFAFQRTRGVWMPWQALGAVAPGERLGSSVALDRDLLAVGAPRGTTVAGSTGHVRLYRQNAGGTWEPAGAVAADNAEPEDRAGFAVAARNGRIVVGAPLGDQGASSAGAVWTFLCGDDDEGCIQEGEAVSTAMAWGDRFGTALAADRADGTLLAVALSPVNGAGGAVHLYRRAGLGWRQQARLTSGAKGRFGAALAMEARTLVVGTPSASGDSGEVHVFREVQGEWRLRLRLTAPQPRPEDGFGGAVALRAGVIAVSARLDAKGSVAGAVYLFPAGSTRSAEGVALPRVVAPGYGTVLALGGENGDTVAVGAPLESSGAGAIHVFQRNGSSWVRRRLSVAGRPGAGLGTSLALDGDTLLAGAPNARRGAGAAFRFVRTGFDWRRAEELPGRAGDRSLGLAVDLRSDVAAILALGGSGRRDQIDAFVFDLPQKGWQLPDRVEFSAPGAIRTAIPPALAVGAGFCAVSVPGPFPGDRVYVVRLGEP